jgi:cytochrome P450
MAATAIPSVILALSLSVLMHVCLFIRGEWHLQAPAIVSGHVLAFVLLLVKQYFVDHGPFGEVAIPAATYVCGLLVCISVYRLYFHRLRSFPGPRLAALSKLWHVWKCRDSRGHHVLESWHQQYGSFVRTGPNEITIFHPVAYEVMDGPKNRNTRSDWYDLLYPRISSIFTRDKEVHDARRKMWDQALSISSLNVYYERMLVQVRALVSIISEQGRQPLVMNDLMYWFAFDNMGDFGFGHDFGMLRNRKPVDGAFYMRSAISLLGPFSPAIWIPRIAFAFIPGVWKVRHWFQMLEFSDACMDKRMKEDSAQLDIASTFIAHHKAKGADRVSRQMLSGDTATMLVAGSDTTAPSLILMLYFIARYPEHAAKIQRELDSVDWDDVRALSALPHLTATIHESMRLLPAVPTFSSRVVGPEGVIIDGTSIPGGTKICAPRYSIGRRKQLPPTPCST